MSTDIWANFDGQKRRMTIITMIGFALFFLGTVGSWLLGPSLTLVCLPGFALFAFGTSYASLRGFKCPRCQGKLSGVLLQRGSAFRVDKRLRFCPYCGCNLRSGLPAPEENTPRPPS